MRIGENTNAPCESLLKRYKREDLLRTKAGRGKLSPAGDQSYGIYKRGTESGDTRQGGGDGRPSGRLRFDGAII
jgi:hypothetical protein